MKRVNHLLNAIIAASLSAAAFSAVAEDDRSEVLERIKPVGTVAVTGQAAPAKAAKPADAPAPAPATTPTAPAKAEAAPQAATEAPAAPQAAPAAAPQTAAAGVDGEAIYKKTCFACHISGAAGAPKLDDKANWAPRIAKGMDALYQSAFKGTAKGMPPKGTCMACSDDELKAAVDYMVSQAK